MGTGLLKEILHGAVPVSYTHLDVYKRQLLARSTLSQKNKWLDDEGRIYIIYPIAEDVYKRQQQRNGGKLPP